MKHLLAWVLGVITAAAADGLAPLGFIHVPAAEIALCVSVPVASLGPQNAGDYELAETDGGGTTVVALASPGLDEAGLPKGKFVVLHAVIPSRAGARGERQFEVRPSRNRPAAFSLGKLGGNSLELREQDHPVLVYNHGLMKKDGVPADRYRSTYLHPIYGLDGEVLTDDFPKDHYHHRGLFWAWPHVNLGTNHYDLWALQGIEQRFEGWLAKQAGATAAVLGVDNGWYVKDKKVVAERVWLHAFPATDKGRCLDVDLCWIPLGEAVTLAGAEGKSYGGLTLRYAPRTNTVITTPLGNAGKDLAMTRLAWADLSAQFAGGTRPSGAAVFIAPDHPDYPPMWLTRHYGVLCVGWPGIKAQTFAPHQPFRCRYRVWIHRQVPEQTAVAAEYHAYELARKAVWKPGR